jgi:imidazolonepropionase-like amidohydrolase
MLNKMMSILAGWLIDGSGAAVQEKMRIDLFNGIIQSIRKITPPLPPAVKTGASVIDLSECTVLPALMDCHVHLALLPDAPRGLPGDGVPEAYSRVLRHLHEHLTCGVMAVRDGGDAAGCVARYKAYAAVNDLPLDVRASGPAWHRPGRYGQFIGHELAADQRLSEAILQQRGDIDHIKIINSGINSLTVFGKETAPQFDTDEMTDAVRVARQRGFKTMVHANGTAPVKIALDAGCDSIEHGFFMGVENLHQMADNRVTWVPTAYTMLALKQRMQDRGQATDVAQKNFDHQVEQIQMACELGVRIALGTDAGSAGVPHGQALVQEMRVFREAGFSVEQVVMYATHNAAMLLGLPEAGRLKPNMQANLIAVWGDPSQLPESLGAIEQLVYKGKQLNLNRTYLKNASNTQGLC